MLELTLKPMNMYMYVDILTSIMDTLFPGLPFLVEFNSNFAKKTKRKITMLKYRIIASTE